MRISPNLILVNTLVIYCVDPYPASCREGEYERSGSTSVTARDFMVALNVNLNATSTRRADAIAFDVRESGRNIKK
jgi:glutamate formiminotransferase